jgi:hypothetical protein
MSLRYNVNKIHSDLISQFPAGEVKIEEKSNLKFGNFVEISVVNEGKEVKMIIEKSSLENYKFNWFYSENPLNENSDLVSRISSIDELSGDVRDVFVKNRFSEDYLKEINK